MHTDGALENFVGIGIAYIQTVRYEVAIAYLRHSESLLYLSLVNDSILELVNHGDTFCCTNLHFYCISFPGKLFNSSKVMHLLLSLISLTQLKEVLLLMFLLSALCKGLTSIVFHLLKLLTKCSCTEQSKIA